MTKEDDKYRQGRSKYQLRSSYIGAGIAIIGLIFRRDRRGGTGRRGRFPGQLPEPAGGGPPGTALRPPGAHGHGLFLAGCVRFR